MLKTKRILYCDLCEQNIDPEEPFPMMWYPFSSDEINELLARFQELAQSTSIGSVLAGPLSVIAVPRGHRFEFCKGCVDGFMPLLEELKKKAHIRTLERMRTRAEKKDDKDRKPRALFDENEDDL